MSSPPVAKAYCADCGPATVSHAIERQSQLIDEIIHYLSWPLDLIWRGVKPAVDLLKPGRMAPPSFRFLAALGLGKLVAHPDDKLNWRARVLWEEAERRGIEMREFRPFGLPRDIYYATRTENGVADTRLFDGLPRPRGAHAAALNWMDDKGVILKKFGRAGIPMPRGGSVKTVAEAERTFRAIGGPAIVKPAVGSRSRHTYVHITDVDALRHAFFKAKELGPRVVVEEELPGYVFRITLVDGKIGGVMRREPPHVIGDGKSTVRELIQKENLNPLRHGPIFHELPMDDEVVATLKAQGLKLDSAPKKDAAIMVHPKVSRSFGASTTEMETIHPDNRELFLKAAQVLDDPIVGVDFMIEDMGRSWREQKCGIIECNSLPFIDLHNFPLKGPTRNVAGLVWDIAFR